MQNYVNQLLADLKKAEQQLPPSPNYKVLYPDHPAHDFDMEYMVAWECSPFYAMSELYGIDTDAFPPIERLTDDQIEAITEGILSLWSAFGTDVSIPDGTSTRQCYKVFVKAWKEEKTQYFPPELGGHCTFDFCSGDVESCKWEEFCSCIKYAAEWERDYEEFKRKSDAGEFDDDDFRIPLANLDRLPFRDKNKDEEGEDEEDLPF